MSNPGNGHFNHKGGPLKFVGLLTTIGVVTSFSIYIYLPYFRHFEQEDYLILINIIVSSMGCYILSGRWITSFWARLFSAVLYGFGPYMLGMTRFHPSTGFLTALIPWLFCPAALWARRKSRWLQLPLSALPFLAIPLFFKLAATYGLYPATIQYKLVWQDLSGLIAPLATAKAGLRLFGFYHTPLAGLLMGLFLTLAARRIGLIVIFIFGALFALCEPIFALVSPLSWLSIPTLYGSILIGIGIQALASAGPADKKWLLLIVGIMGALAVVMLVLAKKSSAVFAGLGQEYAKIFLFTFYMYVSATMVTAIIYVMTRAKLRVGWLRLLIICSVLAVDVFYSSQLLVSKVL